MSDAYYEALRSQIMWDAMKAAIPLAVANGLITGFGAWLLLRHNARAK